MHELQGQGFLNVNIILVDVPGFDDMTKSGLEVLWSISEWLVVRKYLDDNLRTNVNPIYKNNLKLAGSLYLHPILDNRIGESSRRSLYMFIQLQKTLDMNRWTKPTMRPDTSQSRRPERTRASKSLLRTSTVIGGWHRETT